MINENNGKKEDSYLKEILALIREEMSRNHRPAHEVILDDVDLRQLLKVSERTTASLRAKNMITYSKPGKVYYLLSDVLKMMENHRVEAVPDNLEK
ncbi:MAG TPA: hypothetical protein VK787_06970 [Puia sp.]|jgi:hypothetical protein|nr:hypothetical protein [Puia sp.]